MQPSCPRAQTDGQAPPDKLLRPANWDRICSLSPWLLILALTPHSNGKVRVFLFTFSRHGNLKDAGGMISDVAKKQVSVVVHGPSRNVVRNSSGMFELRHFLSFERSGVEAPNHSFQLFAGPGPWVVFRIAPARSDVVEHSVARKRQPAAVIREHVNGKRGVTRLRRRSQILHSSPLALVWPDAHQAGIGTPSGSVDTF